MTRFKVISLLHANMYLGIVVHLKIIFCKFINARLHKSKNDVKFYTCFIIYIRGKMGQSILKWTKKHLVKAALKKFEVMISL